MSGREYHHCKQWIEDGEEHDCWTTTEAALTRELSDDLLDAWERLRETAVSFGDQRIYASHKAIMFSRKSCYFFVRPKKNFLEVCVFLGRTLKAPHDEATRRQNRRCITSFTSSTAMKSRHQLRIGFGKRMNCRTCWCRRQSKFTRNRSTSRSPNGFPLDESLAIVAANPPNCLTPPELRHNIPANGHILLS
jgi:Domain of unknown function (DUF5655)